MDISKAYGLISPAEGLLGSYWRDSRREGCGEVQPCGLEEEKVGGRLLDE